jgi:hypothetical protein
MMKIRGDKITMASIGTVIACGTGVPTDGDVGYAPGCIFIDIDASGAAARYKNVGTALSADFNIEDGGVDLAALTATAAELNTVDTTAGTGAASKAVVLDASGNFIMPALGTFSLSRAAVAAAGVDATDATVLTSQVNAVTLADGTVGVALPAAAVATGPILIINTVLTSGGNLKVYPVSGGNDQINGGAEDVHFLMGPGKAAWFIPTSATQWYVSDEAGVLATTTEMNNASDDSTHTQAITGAGAVTVDGTINRVTLAGGAYAITLASPGAAMRGKLLTIEYIGGDTDAVTLSLANVQGGTAGTTATWNADNETLVLIGGLVKWTVLAEVGVTLS